MCLYGFIPAFRGSYPTIHHPPPARILLRPDNLSLLPLLFLNTIYWYMGLFSSQQTTLLSEFLKTFKRRIGGRAFSYRPPCCCRPSLGDLLYFCSVSSVIFLYDVSVPLLFSILPICSSCPSPPPLPSQSLAEGSPPYEPGPAQGFSL